MKQHYSRRWFLQAAVTAAALTVIPLRLLARATGAFQAKDKDALISQLFGDLPVEKSDAVVFRQLADIAENGAVVPVRVSTTIEGVEQIAIVVDSNPNPLSAIFNLSDALEADVSTRIKVGDSSMVRAFVKTADRVYTTAKEVKVTIGGCGG